MRAFAERLAKDPESIPEHERCPLGGPLQKLADHPVVVGFMNEFVAYPPLANDERYGFRLETSHLFNRNAEVPGKFSPHNGNGLFRMPWDSHYYRCIPGKAWSGLTRVIWEFNPVKKRPGRHIICNGQPQSRLSSTRNRPESRLNHVGNLWLSARIAVVLHRRNHAQRTSVDQYQK